METFSGRDKPGGVINTCAGGVFELQANHAKATKTLDDLANVVAGWRSDQNQLASKVKATADSVANLKKEFEELRQDVGARPSKCSRQRSRSRGRCGCYCAIVRYNVQTDRRLKRGDEVFLRPTRGAEPTLKRYFFAVNGGGFSLLSNDKAGRVRHGRVSNHDMFVKTELCQSCRRGR